MASEAQIAANRLNAQKSTGPRTPEGKAMMRRNPLRHGLSAASVVLFYESEAEFEQFRQDLASDFDPVGAEECALVEQALDARPCAGGCGARAARKPRWSTPRPSAGASCWPTEPRGPSIRSMPA